ncbi:hypothetical protein NIES2135_54010 [Leptolyngbya boryana NIES-2135]|jgi:hypothetical protein|uniref:Uncharacterized protein n=1 Tax=Leptolyngbya boryana NIES-2135 TaxID=1973484 RepID=A0A1Z4JPF7_LEPBY|nr:MULTISPECIES: hypothetical protein [Leptolyngbya]BAY58528.1 hypothetical protein NIES2135_54010 [Leptolyngbya boryana NIES-2135]MBD2370790.1 hypothetical protein [Leptolyngbya sp. FACHB-161]MBD2377057.1 hypothetical protein [Leptolyngbya sp. FACHB-238]MBD2401500.1 hypothetical protein [Leptolyngbya sp. FACHB-239]MBD2408052.1 hypothetical protein [Leptolyngbya sp. FACHB-402]
MSQSNLTEFELNLKALLDHPFPAPKYHLWQTVRFGKKTARICGMYFTRPEIAFAESSYPGWHYHLEGKDSISIIHQDDIDGIAEAGSTSILLPQFSVGQQVVTSDRESGIVQAILYAETVSNTFWKYPGFTYFVEFSDRAKRFQDVAHESELATEKGS